MKKFLEITGTILGIILLFVVILALLTPWMDRWGATDEEIAMPLPGDELVAEPASFVNRAITIQASPEQIYPWLVQIGAKKGGWYSYSWLEGAIQCPITNADRIHPEWQDLKVGDPVEMCPNGMPPAYEVAQIHPNYAIVMGHKENGAWVDLWQFVILPQADGSSRLILRTRTMMVGGIWSIIHPGVFVMEYGLLHGVQARAEAMSESATSAAFHPFAKMSRRLPSESFITKARPPQGWSTSSS
jgi:hypothetical protein